MTKQAPKRKPATTKSTKSPKAKKGGVDSYTIEHLIPTVQYGNVKYVAIGQDMDSVVMSVAEMISKYPPHDPLAEAQAETGDQFNQAAEEVKNENDMEQNPPVEPEVVPVEPEIVPVDDQKAF